MSPWSGYIRWRHSKGYGVHSPYAYRFITDVVNPGRYGYYAYDNLERILLKNGINSSEAFRQNALLLRMLLFLHTRRIVAYPKNNFIGNVLADSIGIGCVNLSEKFIPSFRENDLLLILGAEVNDEAIEAAIRKDVPVLALQPDSRIRSILGRSFLTGLLFDWRDKLLLIPRKDMFYLRYTL